MSGDRPPRLLVLYDGVCLLCAWLTRFLIRRDKRGQLYYAALQGDLAREILLRHGRDPHQVDTVYMVVDYGTDEEKLLDRARAILRAVTTLGGAWRAFLVFRVFPAFLLNLFYAIVARSRYRVFGKSEHCLLPTPEQRARILDPGPGAK